MFVVDSIRRSNKAMHIGKKGGEMVTIALFLVFVSPLWLGIAYFIALARAKTSFGETITTVIGMWWVLMTVSMLLIVIIYGGVDINIAAEEVNRAWTHWLFWLPVSLAFGNLAAIVLSISEDSSKASTVFVSIAAPAFLWLAGYGLMMIIQVLDLAFRFASALSFRIG